MLEFEIHRAGIWERMRSGKNTNKLEATAGQIESCVSSVVCGIGHGDNLQELGPCCGTNHTYLAQESDELEERGGEGQ